MNNNIKNGLLRFLILIIILFSSFTLKTPNIKKTNKIKNYFELKYYKTILDNENIKEIEILEDNEFIIILKVTDLNNLFFYSVIASILTEYLPKTIQAICNKVIGDKDVCKAVYDVSSALVTLNENKISRGIYGALSWVANRGISKSSAAIQTKKYVMFLK